MPQASHFRRWCCWGLACAALLSASACHKKKAASDTTSIDQPHPPDTVPGATPIATLERTGCYGECPVYRLTVCNDGSVVYVGTRWVKVLGRQVFKLSEAQLAELQRAFEHANFMGMKDYDRVENTDDEWAHISLRRGSLVKRVRHYHGDNAAPPALTALEDEFDHIVGSERLVGASSGTNSGTNSPSNSGLASAGSSAAGIGESAASAMPARPTAPTHPTDTGASPDETTADPDNHP